jgi:hypothetical protein
MDSGLAGKGPRPRNDGHVSASALLPWRSGPPVPMFAVALARRHGIS